MVTGPSGVHVGKGDFLSLGGSLDAFSLDRDLS